MGQLGDCHGLSVNEEEEHERRAGIAWRVRDVCVSISLGLSSDGGREGQVLQ